jgi:hypothetical protein
MAVLNDTRRDQSRYRQGHTHAITIDRNGEHKIVSTHPTYDDARKKLTTGKSKGNAIYDLDSLRRLLK